MDAETTLRLALTGDSMITRHALVSQDEATQQLVRLIRSADVAFTNLEVLANDFRGHPAAEPGGTHLAARSWVIDDLIAAGFDLFATATNHSLDYHIEGLLALIGELERRGVCFAGVGRNLAEARMPGYLERPGGIVALLSCVSTFGKGQQAGEQRADMPGRPGVNPLRVDTIYEVTPEQLDALRGIAEGLGLEQIRRDRIQLGFAHSPSDPAILPFLDANFRAADQTGIVRQANRKDIDGLLTWLREARARADVVIVSVHSHERGPDRELVPDFIQQFAREMIDAGADLIVGHGPHLLQGMEVYRGKPIFYSLGNFIAQNDLVERMPADAYDKFKIDPSETPSAIGRTRNKGGTAGFAGDERYWQSVVPVCTIEGGVLNRIELWPITLGHGLNNHRQGRPKLATGDQAAAILTRFAKLSEPFATRFDIDGERATVRIEG